MPASGFCPQFPEPACFGYICGVKEKEYNRISAWLEKEHDRHNHTGFIESDPVCIPHIFSAKEDIEIAGFFASVFAWGQRPMIIKKARLLMEMMDYCPHQFILSHSSAELHTFRHFVYRTFNGSDCVYFIRSLRNIYINHGGMETVFSECIHREDFHAGSAIKRFRDVFFSLPHHKHQEKHISSPLTGSSCKRINLFLRWMVRKDAAGVDFGLWEKIKPAMLLCPLDVHSGRTARHIGLLRRKQDDWKAVLELTENLKLFSPEDPVKYDFALFGTGVNNRR